VGVCLTTVPASLTPSGENPNYEFEPLRRGNPYSRVGPSRGKNPCNGVGFTFASEWDKSYQGVAKPDL